MRRVEYVYNSATRSYERVEPTWRDWGIYAGAVFGLALLLLSLSVWMMDRYSITTPEQQALRVQNQGLARQLQWANEKLDRLLRQAEVLAERDQTFYRRFLRVEPLPEGVRQVGVGGSDSYRRFRREGTSVSPVLRRTGQSSISWSDKSDSKKQATASSRRRRCIEIAACSRFQPFGRRTDASCRGTACGIIRSWIGPRCTRG